ncbi:hypothetical protein K466DRAFT_607337 [Polyporus arcularius HHB13444]|uniref:Endonuclease/exonuclease/phosphatase domain-containing protein n=1 Tax=Polyporus arcularius HHB13444 TaxID=1314778 RepID=A0A5C3NK33_9APHY|nr:hypothetical protein K466DRAFT_607337 [Polyporus arcularius HHB13444]
MGHEVDEAESSITAHQMETCTGPQSETRAGSQQTSQILGLKMDDVRPRSRSPELDGRPVPTSHVGSAGQQSEEMNNLRDGPATQSDGSAAPALEMDVDDPMQGPPPSPTRRVQWREDTLTRKEAPRIATLNMNGYGNLVRDHENNKWGRIYKVLSDQRIGILRLQETHLTDERKAGLHKMFARRIKIFHLAHSDAPT